MSCLIDRTKRWKLLRMVAGGVPYVLRLSVVLRDAGLDFRVSPLGNVKGGERPEQQGERPADQERFAARAGCFRVSGGHWGDVLIRGTHGT